MIVPTTGTLGSLTLSTAARSATPAQLAMVTRRQEEVGTLVVGPQSLIEAGVAVPSALVARPASVPPPKGTPPTSTAPPPSRGAPPPSSVPPPSRELLPPSTRAASGVDPQATSNERRAATNAIVLLFTHRSTSRRTPRSHAEAPPA